MQQRQELPKDCGEERFAGKNRLNVRKSQVDITHQYTCSRKKTNRLRFILDIVTGAKLDVREVTPIMTTPEVKASSPIPAFMCTIDILVLYHMQEIFSTETWHKN